MTMFIQIKDGEPFGYAVTEDNFRLLFPENVFSKIFFPEDVEPFGFGIYEFTQVPETPRFKKLIEVAPVKRDNGIYYQTWSFENMNADEQTAATEAESVNVRNQRKFLLTQCDWTQLPDVSLLPAKTIEWNEYRQALRDISNQSNFPWDIVWPTVPN